MYIVVLHFPPTFVTLIDQNEGVYRKKICSTKLVKRMTVICECLVLCLLLIVNHKYCGIDKTSTLNYCSVCITYVQDRRFLKFTLHMDVTFIICSYDRSCFSVAPASTDAAAITLFTDGQYYLVEWV